MIRILKLEEVEDEMAGEFKYILVDGLNDTTIKVLVGTIWRH